MKFEPGVRIRDRVTLAEGIIGISAEFFGGCIRYVVHPRGNKPTESYWADEDQLEYVDEGLNEKSSMIILGDYVKGYNLDGVVVSKFETTQFDERFVVEEADSGMLHIFNEGQLEKVTGLEAENIEYRISNREYVRQHLHHMVSNMRGAK